MEYLSFIYGEGPGCEALDGLLLGEPGLGKTQLNSRTLKPKLAVREI